MKKTICRICLHVWNWRGLRGCAVRRLPCPSCGSLTLSEAEWSPCGYRVKRRSSRTTPRTGQPR